MSTEAEKRASRKYRAKYKARVKASRLKCYAKHRDQYVQERRDFVSKRPMYNIFMQAKHRAIRRDLPFDLTFEDITIPETCPVLSIPIFRSNKQSDNSPSLDRIKPEQGYIKGNVRVISFRANLLKSNGTSAEHKLIYEDSVRLGY